jgi:DNA-binding NarL/FixJ family response regulator
LIRVLLSGPSPALRAGLRAILATDPEIEVVRETSQLGAIMREEADADVLISASASASALADDLIASSGAAALLLLTDDPRTVERLAHSPLQAWGLLPLEASEGELLAAIHALAEGLIVGPRSLLFTPAEDESTFRGPLTERESQVLALLARGLANKQIALALGISEHTIKFHVSSIDAKLTVTNRTEAVRAGLRGGLIPL